MKKIKEIAEDLIGTVDKDPEDLSTWTQDQLIEFESITSKCANCGYWVETNEINSTEDGPICNECLED